MTETGITIERDLDGSIIFSGYVSAADMGAIRLDPFDRELLKQCSSGTMADLLLGLQTLMHRIEQQREPLRA